MEGEGDAILVHQSRDAFELSVAYFTHIAEIHGVWVLLSGHLGGRLIDFDSKSEGPNVQECSHGLGDAADAIEGREYHYPPFFGRALRLGIHNASILRWHGSGAIESLGYELSACLTSSCLLLRLSCRHLCVLSLLLCLLLALWPGRRLGIQLCVESDGNAPVALALIMAATCLRRLRFAATVPPGVCSSSCRRAICNG